MPTSIDTNVRFASTRQIHAAINHMHQGHFECAITLAGAGEGILPNTDNPHFRQKVKELEQRLPKGNNGEIGANALINWLKHGRVSPKEERIETATISQLEVTVVIWRAISKFIAVYGSSTPQMESFAIWAAKELVTRSSSVIPE
jgi:hypothetical protein